VGVVWDGGPKERVLGLLDSRNQALKEQVVVVVVVGVLMIIRIIKKVHW
jgi:hypothetical protein